MPASGHQDHTASPSASARFVKSRFRVHRIRSRVDDVGQRPSVGKDAQTSAPDLPDGESKIFLQTGLDAQNRQTEVICPSGKRVAERTMVELSLDLNFCSSGCHAAQKSMIRSRNETKRTCTGLLLGAIFGS
jgi:hypothetical protein